MADRTSDFWANVAILRPTYRGPERRRFPRAIDADDTLIESQDLQSVPMALADTLHVYMCADVAHFAGMSSRVITPHNEMVA